MEQAGAEAVELIMWLVMRGGCHRRPGGVHRTTYAPMTTGWLDTFKTIKGPLAVVRARFGP